MERGSAWYHDGIICTGETYKSVVKMTFAKGASLEDPTGLFNSSLEGNTRRAIDIHEGEEIDEEALKGADSRRLALNISRNRLRDQAAVTCRRSRRPEGPASGQISTSPKTDLRHQPAKSLPL